ncbi:DUF4097 family beta strand repeat-containing protein [Flavihumibacter solisilvae]|uniref:Adhesin domain-containing protein n=1 Tax=Flavihumibacter solisilvae TaxID=1349421 RepID=A0A0C1LFK5_9BACT|nr:DUF4097 family beta strand repeat-containing protein [Flavihumibacter solisilvae]KIC94123.1 hypothetical protein OI18_14115 [Flavihumibacter solisilvae]
MKKYLILLFNLFAYTIYAQDSQTPYTTKSFDGKSISQLKVETSGGNITVTGGNTPSRVDVYVRPANGKKTLSSDEIQRKLSSEYDLDVSLTGNKLVAIARPKNKVRDWNTTLSISFVVFVPQNVAGDLATSGGNIKVDGLTGGKQDFTTSGGNLDLKNVGGGKVKGTTSGGNITVAHARDNMELTTSGGNIAAEDCNGDMKLSTSGGTITLGQLNGDIKAITSGGNIKGRTVQGALDAHTSGGNVQLSDLSCSLETSTSGGNIDVEIKTLGKFVKISNSGGNVDVTIPGGKGIDLKLQADKIKTSALQNFTGEANEREITGTMHGGGIPVNIKASSGRVNLVLR